MYSVVDYYTGFGEKEWSRLEREPIECSGAVYRCLFFQFGRHRTLHGIDRI